MSEEEMLMLGTKEKFYEVMNKMALSDRQKKIFELKYLNQWFNEDIAAEIGYCRSVVSEELKIIRHKMAQVEL